MTDYFALLGLPRRPGMDEAALQENYLRLAAAWHPDAPGGDVRRFRDLQEARKTLLDPAARLRHLLELEGRTVGANGGPPYAELFMKIGSALQKGKAVLQRGGDVRSAIAKALWKQELVKIIENLEEQRRALWKLQEDLQRELGVLDSCWPEAEAAEVARLASHFAFLGRWDSEIGAMVFALALKKS